MLIASISGSESLSIKFIVKGVSTLVESISSTANGGLLISTEDDTGVTGLPVGSVAVKVATLSPVHGNVISTSIVNISRSPGANCPVLLLKILFKPCPV